MTPRLTAFDKDDSRRTEQFIGRPYRDFSLAELKSTLLSPSISARLDEQKSTFISGVEGRELLDFSPLFLFHRTFVLRVCRRCVSHIPQRILEPLLERGLVVLVLYNPLSAYAQWFRDLVSKYPHLVVGNRSFRVWCIAAAMHLPGHRGHSIPPDELRSRTEAVWSRVKALPGDLREEYRRCLALADEIHDVRRDWIVEMLEKSLETPTLPMARAIESSLSFSTYLTECRTLDAIPQVHSDQLAEKISRDTSKLRISQPPNMDYSKYLDVIERFRGTLPTSLLAADEDDLLEKVAEINGEIDGIVRSRRVRGASTFFTWVLPALPVLRAVFGKGNYGIDDATRMGPEASRFLPANKVPPSLAALYLGAEEEVVRIWMLRRALGTGK